MMGMLFFRTNMKSASRRLLFAFSLAAAWGVLLYVYLHVSETAHFPGWHNLAGFGWSLAGGGLTGIVLALGNPWLDHWIPWRHHYATRLLLGMIINIFTVAFFLLGFFSVCLYITPSTVFWPGVSWQDDDLLWKASILLTATVFIFQVLYALFYSYQQFTVAQIETLERERRQLELQFEALKSQVSPHYLFNSLNTISSLLYRDPQSAEQFIRRLAQTYQYILSTQHKPFVALREEVEFVQSYYYLLRIRFQQQLSVEINLPANIMHTRIPPLTLQILVENAVKHNHLGLDKKLFIYITAQDNTHLRVINTKTTDLHQVASFKVGLENIRKRYAFFTDRQIEIRDEDKFYVSLPVIPEKQSVEQKRAVG